MKTQRIVFFLSLAISICACQDDFNESISEQPNGGKISKSNSSSEDLDKMVEYIEDVLMVDVNVDNEGVYWELDFAGSRSVVIELDVLNEMVYFRGSEHSGKIFGTELITWSELDDANTILLEEIDTNEIISLSDFMVEYPPAAPCNLHPAGESCSNCFKRELDEFCDGFAGCAALLLMPIPVGAVIAGHYAACCTQ